MMINSNALVSITEANQNFSKVARLVDEQGSAVILKNNVPRYLIVEFSQAEQLPGRRGRRRHADLETAHPAK